MISVMEKRRVEDDDVPLLPGAGFIGGSEATVKSSGQDGRAVEAS